MRTKRVKVTGRVQGVGFRHHTRKAAEKHGVDGWVRNEDDGSVTAVLQGPASSVASVIQAMKHGPRLSSVDNVTIKEVSDPRRYDGFTVQR